MTASNTPRMPTLFVPHGAGPCFFMDWNPPDAWNAMADFLKNVASTLPARPTAIVVVSAHWLVQTVESAAQLREQALATWAQAPSARLCHPPRAEEHLLPLMVAAGASGAAGSVDYTESMMGSAISAYRFG